MDQINSDGGAGMSKVWKARNYGDRFRKIANHSILWVKHSTGGGKNRKFG